MRMSSRLLAIPALLAVLIPSVVHSDDAVTVSTAQQAYAPGDEVTVIVVNNSGGDVFVPGCHPFEVEEFREESYVRLPRDPCRWEGNGQMLPPGQHEFKYTSTDDEAGRIFRIALTWGWECREGVPLSRASCADFASGYSDSYRITGK